MTFRIKTLSIKRAIGWLAAGAILSSIVVAAGPGGKTSPADTRFLGHLSTDKPIYRIGEQVYLRAVILGAMDHAPYAEANAGAALLQIAGPRGETLATLYSGIEDSVAACSWQVPDASAGGVYTATFSDPSLGLPPTKRTFEVRAFRAPRIKGEIAFIRDGYGPGDTVKASTHVERAEGGLTAGAQVNVTAIVDGATAYTGLTTVDASGNCHVEFALPGKIERADATLSLAVSDGGNVETIAKTIPILLNKVDMALYPEGGDLIASLPCRVYFEARTPAHKPADVRGEVVNDSGKAVADLSSEHEGRGRFTFTPVAHQHYRVVLSQPAGITEPIALPEVHDGGVVISSLGDTTAAGDDVRLEMRATDAGRYTITLSKRQTELATAHVNAAPGQVAHVALTPPDWVDGVLVATVKDADGKPVAERLVYRAPAQPLQVKVTTNRASYAPADEVEVTLSTMDASGKPVGAVVGVTATDQSVLQMIEKRERAPRLAEMVMLEDDVHELSDAAIYLDPAEPRATLATDLLLGTQGWRRFATFDMAKFVATYGDAAHRVLSDIQPEPLVFNGFGGGGAFGGGGGGGRGGRAPQGMPGFAMARAAGEAGQVRNGQELQQEGLARDGVVDVNQAGILLLDQADLAANRPVAALLPKDMQNKLASADDALAPMQGQRMRRLVSLASVREYAHQVAPNRSASDRTDFAQTLYWSAGVKTDPATGKATIKFKLGDAISSFDINADGFDSAGHLGQGTARITSVQPFFVEAKMPLEVSTGDHVLMPVSIVNSTSNAMQDVKLSIDAANGLGVMPIAGFNLAAGQRLRQTVDLRVGNTLGLSDFSVHAVAGDLSDSVTRKLTVVPLGFPTEIANAGMISAGSRVVQAVDVPDSVVPGSMKTHIALYPTPLANLNEALQRLLVEPNGCFEQTSSTNYPLVMAQQYFLSHTNVDPALVARGNTLLGDGYNRLIAFECKNKGYEWFGEDPGHECLSAYGLMEFTDMQQVHSVDQAMLANTRAWLLARRDGSGGFTHERRALHTWIADPDCSNSYCTWALLETGQLGLEKEIAWVADHAKADSNSYVKALAANVMMLAGDKAQASEFLSALASAQDADGHIKGATTSVVGSGGESLDIETTALATLAFMLDPAHAAQAAAGVRYLADACKGGRYGSTQSTVLALRAIVLSDKANAHPRVAGSIQLFVDGLAAGEAKAFDAATTGAIELPDAAPLLKPGKHTIELRETDGSELPYAVAINFNSVTPASSDKCALTLTTKLISEKVNEGDATQMNVSVTNVTAQTQPTPIAIVGLPGGLEVRHDQLKELVKAGTIAAYEVRGREVVLYWRDIGASQKIELPLSLTAAIPGTYTAPASREYLYYTDENKQWVTGEKVEIAARN